MKQYRTFSRMMAVALTASVLFAGTAATARDRDGVRRMKPKSDQRRSDTRRTPAPVVRTNRSVKPVPVAKTVVHHKPAPKVIHVLPRGYRTIRTVDRHYYYHNGVYYTRYGNGYEIISAPRFRHLPRHARRVVVNRVVYYVCDDVYYRPYNSYYEICEAPSVRSSIEFNAGPVKILLTDVHY